MKYLIKFESFSMYRELCDRCKNPTGGVTIMSMFNEDIICMDCKGKEKDDPEYSGAQNDDIEEIKSGNYNYKGSMPDYNPLN